MDTTLLSILAEKGNGVFQQVTSPEQIPQVYGYAIGNITTVVARDLNIHIEVIGNTVPCEISKRYTKEGAENFSFPTLSQKEQKDLIFLLKPQYTTLLESSNHILIEVYLNYTENDGTKCPIKGI